MPAACASRSAARHGGRVGRSDGDAVDALGDQVGDDLHLLLAAAMLARTGEHALDLVGADLFHRLVAAELGLVEEGVVEVLRHHRDGELFLRARRAGNEAAGHNGQDGDAR